MAFRSQPFTLLNAASKSDTLVSAQGGLRAFVQRLRDRLSTGKILRPDVQDDVLRQPVSQSKFRHPSPGSQQPPVVPQGPYEHVFNIEYHSRDARRRHTREQVNPAEAAATAALPPTPGTPARSRFLGMAGDFDRRQ